MSRCLGFVLEPLQLLGVQGGGERQYFQGHASAERQLLSFVDHSHTTATNLADDAKVAERSPFKKSSSYRTAAKRLRRQRLTKLRGSGVDEFQTIDALR